MICRVTAVATTVDGGVRVVGLAGPGGPADSREWWPGWPERYTCQREEPPCPG